MNPFRVMALPAGLDRNQFNSGSAPLDDYFRAQVGQYIRRRITGCFVALTAADQIAGYYTLASASVPLTEVPDDLRRKLPRYPAVPAVRMGRLAVAIGFKGQGLGGALLYDALLRSQRSEIVAYALIVDAIDDAAVAFYEHHGFIALPERDRTLMLPLETVKQAKG
jgi:ribosomal protein S18 acetylase RimI-like enzyme